MYISMHFFAYITGVHTYTVYIYILYTYRVHKFAIASGVLHSGKSKKKVIQQLWI